jgi:hypothetical protein
LVLFGTPPPTSERTFASEEAKDDPAVAPDTEEPTGHAARAQRGAPQPALLKHGHVYYLQPPELVNELLDVERYAKRWPLIPQEELHASSVQHPANAQGAGSCILAVCQWQPMALLRLQVLPVLLVRLRLQALPVLLGLQTAGHHAPASAMSRASSSLAGKKPKMPL